VEWGAYEDPVDKNGSFASQGRCGGYGRASRLSGFLRVCFAFGARATAAGGKKKPVAAAVYLDSFRVGLSATIGKF